MSREKGFDYLYGVHSVLEKLKGTSPDVVEIFIAKGHRRGPLRSIEEEAKRCGIPVALLDNAELNRLAPGEKHQGVVAKVMSYAYSDFTGLVGATIPEGQVHRVLALDGVTDPRNFGSLLRTAEGMGIRDVIIPKDRSVGVTPTVVKASAGAVWHLKTYRVTNLRRAILDLKAKGYWVVGLDAGAKDAVFTTTYPDKLVVILGSEGSGIRPLLRQECDFLVSIPMLGQVSSLNVVVSAGMFLYELIRQRGGA
ncbi:MAG: 23S rRNA (guanosine(2251)-2'-O)-methyltransferase RlmB [Deltaproteobacteria bacterium]|nr:23S rRNA (guanosine(2251)-2'-O)-methyltransferase RlmB [Deltaproteobacteria bacterium]